MITIYTEDHKLRDAKSELCGGQLIGPHERPSRAEFIIARVHETGLGAVRSPTEFGLDPVLRVHDAGFVSFLERAWSLWAAEGHGGEAIATCWPARRMAQRAPEHIDGLLGYYSLAAETSISPGTWEATRTSANVALTGAELIRAGTHAAFSLCRPPGHHAASDMYGGYCFLNNAAQYLKDQGASRVAILDVDYHHGNGTQDIFYTRDEVLFVSLHCDPSWEFPHFLGYADETGAGAGDGCALTLRLSLNEIIGDLGFANSELRDLIEMHAELPDLWDLAHGAWEECSGPSRFKDEGAQESLVNGI